MDLTLEELKENHKAMKKEQKDVEEKRRLEKEIKNLKFEQTGFGKFFRGVGKVVKFVVKELK